MTDKSAKQPQTEVERLEAARAMILNEQAAARDAFARASGALQTVDILLFNARASQDAVVKIFPGPNRKARSADKASARGETAEAQPLA